MEDERLRKERKDVSDFSSLLWFKVTFLRCFFLWPLFKWLSDFQLLDQKVTAWITLVFIELPTLLSFFPPKQSQWFVNLACVFKHFCFTRIFVGKWSNLMHNGWRITTNIRWISCARIDSNFEGTGKAGRCSHGAFLTRNKCCGDLEQQNWHWKMMLGAENCCELLPFL